MGKSPHLLKKKRRYALTFKKAIVADFESGRYSVNQLSRLHGISTQAIYNWIHRFSLINEKGTRIVEYADSSQEKLRQLQRKVADLERRLGQKQVQLDLYEQLIALASDELGMDLKKSFSTARSSTSKTTET